MRPYLFFILVIACLTAPCPGKAAARDSGTFRGKWWNYYARGLERAERREIEPALEDLKQAVSLRERDQRRARTYGMHFTDYFPHRELGVLHFERGELDQARLELELSLGQEESAKGAFYLNAVRRELLKRQTRTIAPPSIVISSPAPEASTSGLSIRVNGKARGAGLIEKLWINGSPVRVDLAPEELAFDREVSLDEADQEIIVSAEDLLGNRSTMTVRVMLDREGPAVALASLEAVPQGGGRRFRVKGEVADRSPIAKVVINGRELPCGGARACPFDLSLDLPPGTPLRITARDQLGNETLAELDPDRELAAFSAPLKPVLVAFNAPGIFSSDREPPKITLKDAVDLPPVFVDRYQVEGEVFDQGSVDRVTVNGSEVAVPKGKKVYFSKVVKLREGANRFQVEAFDRAGNRSRAEFAVQRSIPSALQIGSRMSVSLLPFDGPAKSADLMRVADDLMIGAFVEQKRFQVIEREKLKQVLQEQKLTREKLTDPANSIRLGKLVSADVLLATSVSEGKKSFEVVTRVISSETAEVLEVKDAYIEDKSIPALKDAMEGLAAKIANRFPLVEGMVIGRENKEVLVDLGSAGKIRKSMGVIIYRKGKEIRHPVTGRSLGSDTVRLGEGWFDDIQQEFSKVRLSDRVKTHDIAVKDLLITK